MSDKIENPPAFPSTPTDRSGQVAPSEFGMTLRDYFAAKVMSALISSPHTKTSHSPGHVAIARLFAEQSYEVADAMLAERVKYKEDK